MDIKEHRYLETSYVVSFSLYFIFNFYDRHIASIFLLICLFLCLIDFRRLYELIKTKKELVTSIILFSAYISLSGFIHNSPLHELDNYYRFLFLLPLLLVPFNTNHFVLLITVCAFVGLMQAILGYSNDTLDIDRFSGTANGAITYANMCATLFIICIYFIFFKNIRSISLFASAIVFFVLMILTGTRGPLVGIIIALLYLTFAANKINEGRGFSAKPLMLIFFLVVSIIMIPNPLAERLKEMKQIDFEKPLEIKSKSLRERLYYLDFGTTQLSENYLIGIGPQNLESLMSKSLDQKGNYGIFARDHLHNEFLDISLKFGLVSLILLFFIYYFIVKSKSKDNDKRVLLNIIIIMLVSSQLTQSQFAHHQAITFFITMLYFVNTGPRILNKTEYDDLSIKKN